MEFFRNIIQERKKKIFDLFTFPSSLAKLVGDTTDIFFLSGSVIFPYSMTIFS